MKYGRREVTNVRPRQAACFGLDPADPGWIPAEPTGAHVDRFRANAEQRKSPMMARTEDAAAVHARHLNGAEGAN